MFTMAMEAWDIRLPVESTTVPRIDPVASWAARDAGIAIRKKMRAGREMRVEDIGRLGVPDENSEVGPTRVNRTRGRKYRGEVPEGASSGVNQSCAAGKLPRGMWRNQDLYSMRERKSSVIRGEFFGMVPGVGREGLNHEGHEGPRRKAARDSGSYAGMRSRGIFNFLSKL